MFCHIHSKNLKTLFQIVLIISLFCLLFSCSPSDQTSRPEIKIHYLGHSSFVIQFDNGISILTDYGKFNAWAQWGWDSPINDIGDFVPQVVTYSHTHHEDHYDVDRIPKGVKHKLIDLDSLSIYGIKITPIRTNENSLDSTDNTSFLFTYKKMNILHLGDCQANILNIQDETNRNRLKKIFPETFDLVLMPIEGKSKFIPEAEEFMHLLQPKRVIPMHYWSNQYKEDFLKYLDEQNITIGKSYEIQKLNSAQVSISDTKIKSSSIQIISLEPGSFKKNN